MKDQNTAYTPSDKPHFIQEEIMSKFDGVWDLTVKTFIGDQFSVIDLKTDGEVLTGKTTDNATSYNFV